MLLCKAGLKIMSLAKDKSHGVYHIYHLFDNLDYLINSNKEVKDKINFETLIMAICWHDVWISNQNPKSVLQIIYYQMIEGIRSANMFNDEASKIRLDILTKGMVRYVIRKHSSFQVLPAFLIEAQILFDLDKIEMWNYKRFFKFGTEMVGKKEFYQKYIVRFYLSYSEKMGLYFKDLEKVFKKNSRNFWKKVMS